MVYHKIGLIFKPQRCQKCKRKLGKTSSVRLVRKETYLDKYVWRCCDKECRDIRNIREGNRLLEMFSKVELKIILIYILTHFCFLTPSSASNKTLNLGYKTIRDIANVISEWIVHYYNFEMEFKGKLGSNSSIVEVDESCFFRRKANKGRLLKQIWGLGIVERETGRLFVEVVDRRDAKTLLPIIQKWVSVETSYIVSNKWRAYNNLKKLHYNHETVNHSKYFINPENNLVHTQTIENRWGQMKSLMKRRGQISRVLFPQKIKEIAWRVMNRENIQAKLLEIIIRYNFY